MTIRDFVEDSVKPLTNIDRWSTFNTIDEMSVAEHTMFVAMLAHQFAMEMDAADERKAVVKALYHDIEEAKTGDIPRWAKRQDDKLEDRLDEVENEFVDEMVSHLDTPHDRRVKAIWMGAKNDADVEGRIVAASDILSAIIEVKYEVDLGNDQLIEEGNVERAIDQARDICADIPPAMDFLEELEEELLERNS